MEREWKVAAKRAGIGYEQIAEGEASSRDSRRVGAKTRQIIEKNAAGRKRKYFWWNGGKGPYNIKGLFPTPLNWYGCRTNANTAAVARVIGGVVVGSTVVGGELAAFRVG